MSKLSEKLETAMLFGTKEDVARVRKEIDKLQYQKTGVKPKAVKYNTIRSNNILNNDMSPSIKIYDFLNKTLGEDWWEWEIETIDQLLWEKYGVALSDTNKDKVLAIRHLCNSDRPFFDWFEFNQLCLSFGNAISDFDMLRKPSPGMIVNCIKTMEYIRPDRNSFFGNDVLDYICINLKDDGVYTPPSSINGLINKNMKNIVSNDTYKAWGSVYKKYSDIINSVKKHDSDLFDDVQANRLVRCEAASQHYLTGK